MEFGGRFTWNDEQTSRCQAVDFPDLALENTEKKKLLLSIILVG